VEIARGKRGIEDLAALLEGRQRGEQSPAAPAAGLSLVGVTYTHEDRTPWEIFPTGS
jgi:tRNA U38,U39,U40 pseudouridine synthase TruA